jgi:hypothetical protein
MKKRKILYMMLPLVILVWGFVCYQLFSSFFTTPNYAKAEAKNKIAIAEVEKEAIVLVANYRDPFLGKKAKYRGSPTSSVAPKTTKVSPVKITKKWPQIRYKGMIKNNNSDKRVGIFEVNGKEYLINEKETVSEIKFLSITKHEVKVLFQQEKKTITK